jgi:hypothetical protein
MAVTQISRIQHRRGLEQDLPQLASAELGWSVDTQKLYIGNGTLEEGAPQTGITEILTTHSITNIASLLGTYQFYGDESTYSSQTGTSTINPTTRSYQHKLDDFVNIRDFGAKGNGIDDDTNAINRALQQIYKAGLNEVQPLVRRTIYFPGGTYPISNTIYIPPYARLVGDGAGSSIIKQTQGNHEVANVCDSQFQSGSSIGSSSAVLPRNIELHGLQFYNSNSSVQRDIFVVDSSSNVSIQDVYFRGNINNSFYPNLVSMYSTVSEVRNLSFYNCKFTSASNAIAIVGSAKSINVNNNLFDNISNTAVVLGSVDGFSSTGNYFGNILTAFKTISGVDNNNISSGDYFYGNNSLLSGTYLGSFLNSTSKTLPLSTSAAYIPLYGGFVSSKFNYELANTTAKRTGTITFSNDGTNINYTDDYAETSTSVKANVYLTTSNIIITLDSGVGTMKFNYQTFQ